MNSTSAARVKLKLLGNRSENPQLVHIFHAKPMNDDASIYLNNEFVSCIEAAITLARLAAERGERCVGAFE
jgi:hypothetical protein